MAKASLAKHSVPRRRARRRAGPTPVAIIMGSQSDWPTMTHAATTLDAARRRPRSADRVGAPHARPALRVCQIGAAEGLQGHHRRRRRRRAPARHDRIADVAAGARRADAYRARWKARIRSCRSCRCRRAFRSARSPSARPAPSTPRCWRPRSWRCPTRRWRGGSMPGARGRPPRRQAAEGLTAAMADKNFPCCGRARPSAFSAADNWAACWRWPPRGSACIATSIARKRIRRRSMWCAASREAGYDDEAALAKFADAVDVITYEFENVPVETAAFLCRAQAGVARSESAGDHAGPAGRKTVRHLARLSDRGVRRGQQRRRSDARRCKTIGRPAVLKTRRFGYDGKGQAKITADDRSGRGVSRSRRRAVDRRGVRAVRARNLRRSPRAATTATSPVSTSPRTSTATTSCAARWCRRR